VPVEAQGELVVVGVSPTRHALRASRGSDLVIEFDRPVDRSTVTTENFWAFGRWSGAVSGTFRFSNMDRTVRLVPDRSFSAGELVLVVLSRDLQGTDGAFLRRGGYSFQFWIRSQAGGMQFDEITRFSTRSSPTVSTRPYGGFGSDLNGDGRLDVTIVNEDTNDLRTYLNQGTEAVFSPSALEPFASVGNVPSPNEPADFDRDGNVDIVVANTRGSSISILLGQGDGTFSPDQRIAVGGEPRGVTVLDADGDGDIDIAASTFIDGRVVILENDGRGRFFQGSSFGTGGGERSIASADMNDDGLLDLVVGTQTTEEVHIYTNRGDGTFDRTGVAPSGGATWMLVLGDVDGDRREDVAIVNGRSNSAAIVLGDGRGGFGSSTLFTPDPFPLATDLADLDGDGDLDWITSSFDGDWVIFENNGRGAFSDRLHIAAPEAASCSIPMDFDNDGALDLVLIDEIADELIILRNSHGGTSGGGGGGGPTTSEAAFSSDFEGGDTSAWARTRGAVSVAAPGLRNSAFALDVPLGGGANYLESRVPRREEQWQVSFDLLVNGASLGGEEVDLLHLTAGLPRARLVLFQEGARYWVRLMVRGGDGTERQIGQTAVPANRTIHLAVEWAAASDSDTPNGRAALIKKNRVRGEVSDLANQGQMINKVRIGAPAGSASNAVGALRIDNYSSGP